MITIDELNKKLEMVLEGVRIGMRDTIDVSEAALMFGRSEQTIRRWMKERKIPFYCGDDGRITFSRKELDRCMRGTRRVQPISELH